MMLSHPCPDDPQAFARYLQQRLITFGAVATIPTAHCNLGQKLAWYTERIE